MPHCKILIIDDDPAWLAMAVNAFFASKYKVYSAATCADGLKLLDSYKPDCILLDYGLPDVNADVFCRKVRSVEKLVRIPIIVVSGSNTREMEAITDCQADAFVLKGGSIYKTQAIVEMVMRRVKWDRGILEVGDIRLDKNGFQVFRHSKPVANLSIVQFKLIYLLMQESPSFLSETQISQYLYNSDFPPEKEDSIRGVIHRLRKKLGPQLGARIKNKSSLGWIYVQSRLRRSELTIRPPEIQAV